MSTLKGTGLCPGRSPPGLSRATALPQAPSPGGSCSQSYRNVPGPSLPTPASTVPTGRGGLPPQGVLVGRPPFGVPSGAATLTSAACPKVTTQIPRPRTRLVCVQWPAAVPLRAAVPSDAGLVPQPAALLAQGGAAQAWAPGTPRWLAGAQWGAQPWAWRVCSGTRASWEPLTHGPLASPSSHPAVRGTHSRVGCCSLTSRAVQKGLHGAVPRKGPRGPTGPHTPQPRLGNLPPRYVALTGIGPGALHRGPTLYPLSLTG